MHAQNITVSLFCQSDRIIQILRILAVNRHGLPAPHILTSCHISVRHCLCHTLCLIQYLLRKFGWQIISFDNRQNINSRIGHMPQDLYDLSFRLLSILPIRGQLDHNLMPGHSSFRALCRYEDILQETLIIRHNESEILPALIIADDPLGSPLYDLRDLSFSSLSFRCFGDDNLYLISLHGTVHIIFRDKDIFTLTFHGDKAEASRICLEYSPQLLCLTFNVFSFLCDMYPAFFFQAVHDSFEFPFLIFRDLKQHRQLFQLHRHIKFITDKFINNFLSFFK